MNQISMTKRFAQGKKEGKKNFLVWCGAGVLDEARAERKNLFVCNVM